MISLAGCIEIPGPQVRLSFGEQNKFFSFVSEIIKKNVSYGRDHLRQDDMTRGAIIEGGLRHELAR